MVETYMATDLTTVENNIRKNLQRNLPEIENLPEWKKSKKDFPLAVAGGGPSIKYTVDTLRNFKIIIAAGSAHDWLVEHNIIPTYCLIIDPDPISANYLKHPQVTTNYLVASCCDPKVFDTLNGYQVTRWHSAGNDPQWYDTEWQKAGLSDINKKPVIGGGCTCGLRAISIAMLFGYANLHFFGMDSNLDLNTNEHHAYNFVDPVNEHLGDVITMRLGDKEHGRVFKVAKYMMAQLWGFKDLIQNHGHRFNVTVHGDSIIYEFMRIRNLEIERLKNATQKIRDEEIRNEGTQSQNTQPNIESKCS